ncbi:MAG: Crp/Fnr family transcriptional regulator [Candidatus Pacebacteria bacterium]|nr:Crp/Fnr family transcriptional regulator [Candidatus Paceibacterota bacterium]
MTLNFNFIENLKGEPRVSLRAGDVLFEIGDPADSMYFVESGMVRIGTGQFVFEEAGDGTIVGELGIIDGTARSATGWAAVESTLIKVSPDRFFELVRDNPDFALAIMRVIAKRLRIMNRRVFSVESIVKPATEN